MKTGQLMVVPVSGVDPTSIKVYYAPDCRNSNITDTHLRHF